MTIEEIEKQAIQRYLEQQTADDPMEAIIRQIDRIRATMTMVDRVKGVFEHEPGDAPYTDEQLVVIGEILELVKEAWPATPRATVIPPEPARPSFRKLEPVMIEGEAEGSAADHGISMGYEAEAQSTHTDTHIADAGKPAQRSLWDDPAAAFGQPADGPFNPEPEFVQVTRRRGGGIGYLVNGKLRG